MNRKVLPTDPKVLGSYKTNANKSAFYEDAVWKGQQTPAAYNTIDTEKYKMTRTQIWKISKPLKEVPRHFVKDNSPSPNSYRVEEKFIAKSNIKKNIQYSVPKAPKTTNIDLAIKRAKKVPGVGKYEITKADKRITLGARRGYK